MLKPNHEMVGIIRDIIVGEDDVKIIFSLEKEIELPKCDTPKEITRELIGQCIGILNIENKYHFRRV